MNPKLKSFLACSGSFLIVTPLVRQFLVPIYRDNTPHPNKVVIVTGATGIIGSAVAFQLAIRKVRVIMACRDMDKCKLIRRDIVLASGNRKLVCRHLDLEDKDSINKFADQMVESEPHIDVLINCAAIKGSPQRELTKYGVEKQYYVNFLGPLLLTLRLMDKLIDSGECTKDSRIVNVVGNQKKDWKVRLNDINFDNRTYHGWEAYFQSKLALAYATILLEQLQAQARNHLYVYAASPCGWNFTDCLDRPTTDFDLKMHLVQNYTKFKSEFGAAIIVRTALAPTLSQRLSSGKLYSWFAQSWSWNKTARDQLMGKYVWNDAMNLLAKDPKVTSTDRRGTGQFVQNDSDKRVVDSNLPIKK